MLLEKFVPELFENSVEEFDGRHESMSGTGKNVNISIDDPIDLSEGDDELSGASDGAAMSDLSESEALNGSNTSAADDVEVETLGDASTESTDSLSEIESAEDEDPDNIEELNELPDLQEFVPAEVAISDSDNEDFTQMGTGKFDVSAEVENTEIDTNIMTQAVKTVLRRDS